MKQCCFNIVVRGPQHLMDTCGTDLPRGSSVVLLSESDVIEDIQESSIENIVHQRQTSHYVICCFSPNLEIHPVFRDSLTNNQFLRDILIFNDSHWKSALCNSEQCCPPAGKTYTPSVTTCRAIAMWQDALADTILNLQSSDFSSLLQTLNNLDVRDWVLAQALSAHRSDWLSLLNAMRAGHNTNVALLTILAGYYYAENKKNQTRSLLDQAQNIDSSYSLLVLLQRSIASDMPVEILHQSLSRFETTKRDLSCLNKVSLLPKASPPTATRTGER